MQFHEMYMDKIHNHEVAGSIPAPATDIDSEQQKCCSLSLLKLWLSTFRIDVSGISN